MTMISCNFFMVFMSLLKTPIVKNSHILTAMYFIFPKKMFQTKVDRFFNTKFGP